MTAEELKEALLNNRKVISFHPMRSEMEHDCVSAVIYRMKRNGAIAVSAEVLNRATNSVMIVEPKYLKYKERR